MGLLGFIQKIPQDIEGAFSNMLHPQQQPQPPAAPPQAPAAPPSPMHTALQTALHLVPFAQPIVNFVQSQAPNLENAVKAVQGGAHVAANAIGGAAQTALKTEANIVNTTGRVVGNWGMNSAPVLSDAFRFAQSPAAQHGDVGAFIKGITSTGYQNSPVGALERTGGRIAATVTGKPQVSLVGTSLPVQQEVGQAAPVAGSTALGKILAGTGVIGDVLYGGDAARGLAAGAKTGATAVKPSLDNAVKNVQAANQTVGQAGHLGLNEPIGKSGSVPPEPAKVQPPQSPPAETAPGRSLPATIPAAETKLSKTSSSLAKVPQSKEIVNSFDSFKAASKGDLSYMAGKLGVDLPEHAGAENYLREVFDKQKSLPSTQTPAALKWAQDNGFAPKDSLGMNKESLRPEGVTQEQLDRAPKGTHLGNSKQAIEGKVQELHGPNPVRATPRTPSLSDEHLDVPGKAPYDIKQPKVSLKPPTTEGSMVKTFGAIKTIIGRQGEGGKELARRIVGVRETHARIGQAFKDSVPTVMQLKKGGEFKNFVDTVEGRTKPANPKIAQAVTEWQRTAKAVEQRALDANIHMGHIEDYFPHTYDDKLFTDKKTYNQAVEHLVNTGQATDIQNAVQQLNQMREPHQGGHRFGNLEKARNADIPGYKMDKHVVANYLDRSARRIAESEHLGRDNEHVDRLLGQIAKEGKDANSAQEAFNAYFRPPRQTTAAKVGSAVRKTTNVLTLSKAAISHSTQTSNTAIVTGIVRTGAAWVRSLNPATRAWVRKIGVNYDGHAGGHVSAIAPGLKQMRAQNRIVSALAGRSYGNALAKAGKVDELRNKWGVQGEIGKRLTEDQQAHMAHAMADATQFSDDPADLPMWARTPGGKMVGQYRLSYQYKQGGFLFDQIIKEAGRGNIAPLLRAMAVVPVAGAAVVTAKHLLGSKTTASDPMAVAEAGGLGTVPTALLDSTRFMYNGKSTAENLAGDVAPLAGEAVSTAFNIKDAMAGNAKNLEKQGLGYIPFIGAGVKNAVFPSNPADPNAIAYVQTVGAGGKGLSNSKDQAVYTSLFGSNKDKTGATVPAVYDPNNSPFVAEALLSHPNVLAAATAAYQDFNSQTGQTIDPLYNLPPEQQKAALELRAASAYPGELKEDKSVLTSQLPSDWQTQQDAYYASVAASLAAAGKDGGEGLPGAPKYPQPSAQVEADLKAGNTKNNPAVSAYLDSITAYNNEKRKMMGLPEIAPYGTVANSKQITNPSTYTSALKYASKTGFHLAASSDGTANSVLAGLGIGGGGAGHSGGGSKKLPSGAYTFHSKTALSKLIRSTSYKPRTAKSFTVSDKTPRPGKLASTKMTKIKAPQPPKLRLVKLAKGKAKSTA